MPEGEGGAKGEGGEGEEREMGEGEEREREHESGGEESADVDGATAVKGDKGLGMYSKINSNSPIIAILHL